MNLDKPLRLMAILTGADHKAFDASATFARHTAQGVEVTLIEASPEGAEADQSIALMIHYQPAEVAWMCTAPTVIAYLIVPYDVKGLEQGAPVTSCHLEAPIPSLWGRLRNFS